MNKIELLHKQEITELTNLLKYEWDDTRNLIEQNNIDTNHCLLVTYLESEDCVEFGILITKTKQVLKFTIENDIISIEEEADVQKLQDDFPQVKIGLDMLNEIEF